MSAISLLHVAWDMLFVSEADAARDDGPDSGTTTAGHRWYQHWPGVSSFAMLWLVHKANRERCVGVRWQDRAGALTLRARAQPDRQPTGGHIARSEGVTFIGMHGSLSIDALTDSLSDTAALYRTRWRPGPGVLDVNVDQLPATETNAFRVVRGRDDHHREARKLLQTW